MHVNHRRAFDDAVSFRSVRSWRAAGRLYSAYYVELDEPGAFRPEDVNEERLAKAIGKKLGTSGQLSISWVDLPEVREYPPSILVIVRFPGQQTSVAVHGDGGERRLFYYLPQDEAILVYTPAMERIEVAAAKAAVRNAVADCFAQETLGHNVSAKPLTWASYDTARFLQTMDLPVPALPDFTVLSARVIELELRVDNWQTRLSLKAGGGNDMVGVVARYLEPGQVLRRALGVSRVLRDSLRATRR